ncbi:Lrp/AsnC family transcriptional regulator [bacterium]|jgi:siroheme decarboxylase|nr:Lrp/AsnC family transcriptional regulator [bacterium]
MREELLHWLQEGLPLVARPFSKLAEKLGCTEEDILGEIEVLKKEKIIRRLCPIFDTKLLGYDSALVAFRVNSERIELIADDISSHPGVSHNYERNHDFNLWFTIATEQDSRLGLERTVAALASKNGVEDFSILRSTRTFKIGVKLSKLAESSDREQVSQKVHEVHPLLPLEKEVVQLCQRDLQLVSEPFNDYANELGMTVDSLLEVLANLKERGVLRRLAALLFHRKVGFKANGMSVWSVPPEECEKAGMIMASFRGVSHCYERTTSKFWPYNVYAMIHGQSEAEVEEIVGTIKEETGLNKALILYSTREFKKRRINYFSPEFGLWEEQVGGAMLQMELS